MATMASHYDLARFGSRSEFSPRQADMLMVMELFRKNGTYFTSSI
jgi:NADH:ubiquinone oxidoreductase subunit B-like Fe-S oxidoreductase